MKLPLARHWVFDMDGTLTVAVHDFALIRQALDIPAEDDILHHLAALPADQQTSKRAWLRDHELQLARAARPAKGAPELVQHLRQAGCHLAILTRNDRELARLTLDTIGLGGCFDWENILGRDEAPPKPDPAGLIRIAQTWGIPSTELVMVGDYRFDLECADAVGACGVLVNTEENLWPELACYHARDCSELLRQIAA